MKRPDTHRIPLGTRFWRLWFSVTSSNTGDGIVLAALPLLAASLTRSPIGVAATTIAVRLPWLIFGLFAGVIADRVDRRRVMVSTGVGRGVVFGGIAVAVAFDSVTLVALYVLVFGVGILETLYDTASMSTTPSLVASDQLDRANSRLIGAHIAANEFVGPPLGGALFVIAAAAPFGISAVAFTGSALVLVGVSGNFRPARSEKASLYSDVREGLGFLWREPMIRAFAVGAATINLGFTLAGSVLVLHAQDNLRLGGLEFGVLLAAAGVGGIVGAQAAPMVIRGLGRGRSVLLSVVLISGGIATMGWAGDLFLAMVGYAAYGFAGEIWNVVSVTYRQSVSPDAVLGRVMGAFRVIAYGTYPVGAALGGLLAASAGLRSTFFVGATLIVLLVPYLAHAVRHSAIDQRGASMA
jgi:MFS family permease